MTKGTRMWLTGMMGIGFWLFTAGVISQGLISNYEKGNYWTCAAYFIVVLAAFGNIPDSLKLVKQSHNEE